MKYIIISFPRQSYGKDNDRYFVITFVPAPDFCDGSVWRAIGGRVFQSQ